LFPPPQTTNNNIMDTTGGEEGGGLPPPTPPVQMPPMTSSMAAPSSNYDRKKYRCQTAEDALENWNQRFEDGEQITGHHFREWWRQVVPKLLSPVPTMDYLNPTAHLDEDQIKKELIDPLEMFLCGIKGPKATAAAVKGQSEFKQKTPEEILESISALNDPPSQCGKRFRPGEPTYSCRDCERDVTCVLCIECFKSSEHQHHRYKMGTSTGGGYCDCGDAEAWTSNVHCSTHILGTEGGGSEGGRVDPLSKLPEDVGKRARHLFTAILNYAYEMLTTETHMTLPSDLTYKKILYLDDGCGGTAQQVSDYDSLGDIDFDSASAAGAATSASASALTTGGGVSPSPSSPFCLADSLTQLGSNDVYAAVVYNDEVHTFDEVIGTLPRAADCQKEKAIGFATLIDREGRCLVKCSGFTACTEVKNVCEKMTGRRGGHPLKVVVTLGHVMAHQAFALRLLSWLQDILDKSVGFRALFSQIMFDKNDVVSFSKVSRLEAFLRHDTLLWKAARAQVHHLFGSGMMLENETKKSFAEVFTRCYGQLIKDFISDDHEHPFSVTSLSVQLFTVPTLAMHLIAHCDVLANLLRTFMSESERRKNNKGKLEFLRNLNLQSFKRASYILYDLKYVLNTPPKPDQWTKELRMGFLHGLSMFLSVLLLMEGMDPQTRQATHHVEYEIEWEAGFNMHVKLAPLYGLIVSWCITDRIVFIKALRMIFKKLAEDANNPNIERAANQQVTVDQTTVQVTDYQVSSKPISFHQPLTRLLAALAVHMSKFESGSGGGVATSEGPLDFDANEFDIPEKPEAIQMLEPSLRLAVVVAQVQAGMWRRNGYSVVEQIRVYHDPRCRREMQDKDILMLQLGASLMSADHFLINMLNKFQLTAWAEKDFNCSEDDSVRQTTILVEEFLSTLIVVVSERWTPGIGQVQPEDGIRREIIQLLSEGPMSHSALNRALTEDIYRESQMEKVVKSVANFKKPNASSSGLAMTSAGAGRGVYELKPEFHGEYSVFFYHYTKEEQSRSEEVQRKRKRAGGEAECNPPPLPPHFTKQFSAILDLLKCDVYVYLLSLVLIRADNLKSRCFSENQVHRVLHLIGLSLLEEERYKSENKISSQQNDETTMDIDETSVQMEMASTGFDFTARAAKFDMYRLLEQLVGSQRIESHKHLLDWVLAKWRKVAGNADALAEKSAAEGKKADTPTPAAAAATPAGAGSEGGSEAESERKRLAAERRKKIMAQMQKAQKNFMTENARLFEDKKEESATKSDEQAPMQGVVEDDAAAKAEEQAKSRGNVALGPQRTPPAAADNAHTCILCQEEEKLTRTGKTLVMASFVQKSTVLSNKKLFRETAADSSSSEESKQSEASALPATAAAAAAETMTAAAAATAASSPFPVIRSDVLPADLFCVPHVASCGHVMHSDCFEHFFNDVMDKKQRTGMRQPRQSYNTDKKEFLCPMCRCLSNSVIPLIPQYSTLQPPGGGGALTPDQESQLDFGAWVRGMMLATKYAKLLPPETADEDSSNISSKLPQQQLSYTCPLLQVVQELSSSAGQREDDEAAAAAAAAARVFHKIYSEGVEDAEEMAGVRSRHFSEPFPMSPQQLMHSVTKSVCVVGFGQKEVELSDPRTPMATWQATAFTLHSTVWSCLDSAKKSVLDPMEMSIRHKECLNGMVRFSGLVATYFCEPKVVRSHGLKLLSILLGSGSSDSSILEVDAVGILVPLTFTLPSLFNGDNGDAPLPIGNVQDLHSLRLVFLMHLVQILLTTDDFTNSMDLDEEEEGESEDAEAAPILGLMHKVRSAVGFSSDSDGTEGLRASSVWNDVKVASLPFMRCAALFYHHLTNVPGPDNLQHLADNEFEVLAGYLSLPTTPAALLAAPPPEAAAGGLVLDELVKRWTSHPGVASLLKVKKSNKVAPVTYPIKVNGLVPLPHDYSELINSTSGFTCPRSLSDDARVPAMCLVCGEVLCSQSYCCQMEVEGGTLGACMAHTETCGGGAGIFLRVRECKVVLLAGRTKGIFIQPPYVDQYGETDTGLRRGNPLHLCQEKYRKLNKLWLNHSIPKEISSSLESNPYYTATPWFNL